MFKVMKERCDQCLYGKDKIAAQEDVVAWRYRHKGDEGWYMLKDGADPREWLKRWPDIEYDVQALGVIATPQDNPQQKGEG